MSTAGYSGTPLAKKLGIKPAATLAVLNDPGHFMDIVAPLPRDLTIRTNAQANSQESTGRQQPRHSQGNNKPTPPGRQHKTLLQPPPSSSTKKATPPFQIHHTLHRYAYKNIK